jgi:hypothetical protein
MAYRHSKRPFLAPRRRRLTGDLGRRAALRVPERSCWAQGAGAAADEAA